MTLFLDLSRERLLAVIVAKRQGMGCGRPLMDSTIVGRDKDAHVQEERRWGYGSRDTTLAALEGTYSIRN